MHEQAEVTVERAIKRSIAHTEIVTIVANDDGSVEALLYCACTGSVVGNDVSEYWGERDTDHWRVHVRR
jgi:hypothetical protein